MYLALLSLDRPRFDWLDYLVLVVYLAGILAVGLRLTSSNRGTDDFFLGGRRIPWWAAGLSIYGTQLSSITFMALPAKAYVTDWTYALVNVCILLVTPVVVFYYVPFFHRLKVTTAYEYLEMRFNLAVRLFASALFIVFQLGRFAIVLFLPSLALATVADTNIYLCIVVMGGLAIVYTFLGGIQAVIWTDVVQSVVLLGSALASLTLALTRIPGGAASAFSAAVENGKLHMLDWSWDFTTTTVWVMILGNFASVLATYTTDQSVIQKYLTTSTEKKAAKSIWANSLLAIPSTIIFFAIGTALWAFYRSFPDKVNPALSTDAIFPWFIIQQLPHGVAGLVVAGLFAAAQSTVSSSVHSVATAIMVDFYRPFRPHASDGRRLRLARILTVALGTAGTVVALVLATYDIRSLYDAFLTLLSLLGGSLAGVFALGIFTRRASATGVLLGGALSAALVVAARAFTQIHFFLYAAIGMMGCLCLGYIASLVFPDKPRDLRGLTIHDESL